jgi:long-chain acyl-CoA synthetase
LIGLGEMRGGGLRWFRSGQLEIRMGKVISLDNAADPAELTERFEDSVRRLISD